MLSRIPLSISRDYDTEVLVIDDASHDQTFERSQEVLLDGELPFPLTVLFNPVNQGYGGNQKIGYHYAIKHGFDFVALMHGDGQYAPECLPDARAAAARRRSRMRSSARACWTRACPCRPECRCTNLSATGSSPGFENRVLQTGAERIPFRLSGLFGRGAQANPV